MKFFHKIKNRDIDGRWFLGGSHFLLVLISLLVFNLQRSFSQIAFGYIVGFMTEYFWFSRSEKYKDINFFDRAFSAATETAGLLVLLKSHIWWFYGFLSFIAVSSKYLLRKDNTRHIFNPTNFAITFSLIILPIHWFGAWPDEFMMSPYPMIQVTIMGMIATWLGRTYIVSVSYVLSLVLWCFVFFPIHSSTEAVYALGPEFGAIGLIYLFLMITDPKTAPKNYLHQVLYGSSISFVHIYLRTMQLLYSRYIALFFITLVYFGLQTLSALRTQKSETTPTA